MRAPHRSASSGRVPDAPGPIDRPRARPAPRRAGRYGVQAWVERLAHHPSRLCPSGYNHPSRCSGSAHGQGRSAIAAWSMASTLGTTPQRLRTGAMTSQISPRNFSAEIPPIARQRHFLALQPARPKGKRSSAWHIHGAYAAWSIPMPCHGPPRHCGSPPATPPSCRSDARISQSRRSSRGDMPRWLSTGMPAHIIWCLGVQCNACACACGT